MTNPTNCPEDHVYQFAASHELGNDQGTCFTARLSGLYRSTDSGFSWVPALDSLNLPEPLAVLSVAIPTDFKHDPSVFIGLNGGILHSPNGGESWKTVEVPSPSPVVLDLVCSPDYTRDGILFAATMEDGILYSSDRGRRWAAWNFGLMDLNTLCIAISPDFANDETLFVGTQSGLFRSTNSGRAWREVDLPVGFDAVLSLAVSPKFSRDATLFVGTESHGLLYSADGGRSWQRLGKSQLKEPVNVVLLVPEYPVQPGMLVLHGGTLLISANGGRSWKPWRADVLGGKDVTAILTTNGFEPGAPALIGFADGTIACI